jgi:transposase
MIRDLYRKGLSISEIARLTGHDRKTVRRVAEGTLTPPPQTRRIRVGKMDPFVSYLQQRMAEGVFNARKLYGEIKSLGYSGKETQVRSYVQPHRTLRQNQATVRFETAPGEQAQVDWGHFGLIEYGGRLRRLYGFVMTLGWSRVSYLEFTVSTDIAWFLRCHLHAFRYFGGYMRNRQVWKMQRLRFGRDRRFGYAYVTQGKRGEPVIPTAVSLHFLLAGVAACREYGGHQSCASPICLWSRAGSSPRVAVA